MTVVEVVKKLYILDGTRNELSCSQEPITEPYPESRESR